MKQDVDKKTTDVDSAPSARFGRSGVITLIVVAVLLAALAGFQLVLKPSMIKSFMSKMTQPPATISADAARTDSWIPTLPSVGTLTAIQGIDVTAQVAGIVSSISFESGQDVAQGAKLVTLDSAVEQADLANNKALLQQTELDLARQNDLSRRAYASEATQQAAQAKRDSAAAAVQKSSAQIGQKTIAAPFAGRLGIRKVDIGQYVAAGASMVTIQALDPIRADFPVPEQELSRLKVGQQIEVRVDAYPGQTFTGEIETLDARVAADTRSLLVRAKLKNPDKKLLPGMFANISVLAGAPQTVVTVPRTAVTYSLFGDSVFVVKSADTTTDGNGQATPPPAKSGAAAATATTSPAAASLVVERRFVRVGDARGERVAIVDGVKSGDVVVTSGQLKLQNGAKVIVDNTAPMTPMPERPKL